MLPNRYPDILEGLAQSSELGRALEKSKEEAQGHRQGLEAAARAWAPA